MRNSFNVLIIIFTLTSCNTYRYIYSASPSNNPYFQQKGESKLTAYYSTSADDQLSTIYAHGFDLQSAYAFGNHWALTFGYFDRKEKDAYAKSYNLYDTSVIHYKRNLFDIGGGYFTPINTKKNITANLYGGLASGKFSFEDNGVDDNQSVYNRYHESAITKWFIQPSINFMPGEYIRFSFAAKISYVHYGKIKTTYTQEELEYFSLNMIANRTLSYFEPCLNIQFGIPEYPWIKIDAVCSGASNYHSESSRLNVRGSNASIGLNFDFSKMKKKKN